MINSLFSYYSETFSSDELRVFKFILEQSGLYKFEFDNTKNISTDTLVDKFLDRWIELISDNARFKIHYGVDSFNECRKLLYKSFLTEFDYFYKQYCNSQKKPQEIKSIDIKANFKNIIEYSEIEKFNSNSIDTSYSRNLKIFKDTVDTTNSYILKALYNENYNDGKLIYNSIDADFCMNIILEINKLPTSERYYNTKYTYNHLQKYISKFIGLDSKDITTNYLLERLFNINSIAKINECYNECMRIFKLPKTYNDNTLGNFIKQTQEERVLDSLVDVLSNVCLSYGVFNRLEIMDIIYRDFMSSASEMQLGWHSQWNCIFKEQNFVCSLLTIIYFILINKGVTITHEEDIFLLLFENKNNEMLPIMNFESKYNIDITHKISNKIFYNRYSLYPQLDKNEFFTKIKQALCSSIVNIVESNERQYDNMFLSL